MELSKIIAIIIIPSISVIAVTLWILELRKEKRSQEKNEVPVFEMRTWQKSSTKTRK